MEASLQSVAGMLLEFNKILPTHGRFVYSSLLLLPGLDQSTFNPMLRPLKGQWNVSNVRYASFYDGSEPMQKLVRPASPTLDHNAIGLAVQPPWHRLRVMA